MNNIFIFLILVIILISGCINGANYQSAEERAKAVCVLMCQQYTGDKTSGPCISDLNAEWVEEDWVCDIAHDPRQDVDNLRENQCEDFGVSANHFVEVSENCEIIRVV